MFRNWGAWLVGGPGNGQVETGEESAIEEKGGTGDVNKPSAGAGGEQNTAVQEDPLLQPAKGLSGESGHKVLCLIKLFATNLFLRCLSTTGQLLNL